MSHIDFEEIQIEAEPSHVDAIDVVAAVAIFLSFILFLRSIKG